MFPLLSRQSTIARCVIALCGLLFTGFAQAQYTISPATGTCITHVPNGTSPTYTFTANGAGASIFSWTVQGDLMIVSQTASSVQVRSTGYGKGRINFWYSTNNCNPNRVIVDVFKTFTAPDLIVGPQCVRPGEKVTFSINPIISTTAQIAAEVGIDAYQWKVNGVDIQGATGWAYSYGSGDKSSITLTAPATLSGSTTLSVAIGKCNAGSVKTLSIGTKANIPTFSGPIPACIPTNNTTPFTVSVIQQAGTTYAWNKQIGSNWSISAPTVANGLNTVTITPDGNAAEISVVATTANGCESAINKVFISRELVAGTNTIAGGTGCLPVGTPVTFSLTNPPANSSFTWTAPAGWSPATATGAVAVFTPSASAQSGGVITCKTSPCSLGITFAPVVSNNKGFTFTIANLDCGLFRVNATNFVKTGATYQWYLNGVYKGSTTGNANSFTFDPWTGAQSVSVRITKAAPDCLDAMATTSAISYGCAGGRMGSASKNTGAEPFVEAFPNPAHDVLTLSISGVDELKEVALSDLHGREVKRFNTLAENQEVNVSALPAGTYLLKVRVGKSLVTRKVVLIK